MAKLPPQPLGVAPGSSYWNDWYEKLRTFVDQITTSVDWAIITGKPTTLVGYGITDGQTKLNNSAGLAAALSDETGTGLAVFNNGPTIVSPLISGSVGVNTTPVSYANASPSIQVKGLDATRGGHLVVIDSANDGWLGMFSGITEANNPALVWQNTGDLRLGTTTDPGVAGFAELVRVTGPGQVTLLTAGRGLSVREGSNCKQGTATLVAGSVVVANTSVTATSRIFVTSQVDGGTPGFLRISTRVAGTSFTIVSSNAADTSTVAYEIFEPS